jgi:hypothetical protein
MGHDEFWNWAGGKVTDNKAVRDQARKESIITWLITGLILSLVLNYFCFLR